MNPWGLTNQQEASLASIAKVGCDKLAAREMGISHRTLEHHVAAARKKMNVNNRVLAVLAWDRLTRGAE